MALPTPYKLAQIVPYLKILVYSNPGVGKTEFAATAIGNEDLYPILLLNLDMGESTIMKKTGDKLEAVKPGYNADGTRNMHTMKDVEDIIWAVVQGKPGYTGFKTIMLDGISELQARNLEELVYHDIKANPNKDRNKGRTVDDINLDDYGSSTANIRRIVRMLRDIPKHVIITAWASTHRDKTKDGAEGPVIKIGPTMTDKLSTAVQGLMEGVWYMYIDKKEEDPENNRVLLTSALGVVEAKTRIDQWQKAIGQKVKNPKLPDLYEKLISSVKG